MGLLDWIKGSDKAPAPAEQLPDGDEEDVIWNHPVIGEMYQDSDTSWLAEEADTPLADHSLEISLEGDDDGPDTESVSACEHFMAHPGELRSVVEDELYAFYDSYFDEEDEGPDFGSPAELWGSEELVAIHFVDRRNFDVSYSFDWQVDGDDHVVTVYVEEGEAVSHSVDG